jgi:hypothetical protein
VEGCGFSLEWPGTTDTSREALIHNNPPQYYLPTGLELLPDGQTLVTNGAAHETWGHLVLSIAFVDGEGFRPGGTHTQGYTECAWDSTPCSQRTHLAVGGSSGRPAWLSVGLEPSTGRSALEVFEITPD